MSHPAPAFLTIADALDALRDGTTTASGLLDGVESLADARDPGLGIYLERFRSSASETAAEVDRQVAAGESRGPLAGIPLGIKDIISTAEGTTTAQSLVLDPGWSARTGDAEVVRRLRAAGAVLTGKLTTMEFATGRPDAAKPFPIPRNPWNPDYYAGGSSSGTASGVAVGAILGGLGTDTGGSIRGPAAFCGISGLKPTFGRVPKSGCVPLGYSVDHVGPMARSARDCAILLGVLAGHHPADACSVDEPVDDYLGALTGDLAGLRIGVDRLEGVYPARDPAIAEAFEASLGVLASLGAVLVDVRLPLWHELMAVNWITAHSEAFAYHEPDLRTRWAEYGTPTRTGIGAAPAISGADYVQAQRVRSVGRRVVAELFGGVDLVVTPTTSVAGMRIDELDALHETASPMHTGYWNPLGNPALAIPMGLTPASLPTSLQIIGRPFEESTVLRAGDAYQRVTDFHLAVPPG